MKELDLTEHRLDSEVVYDGTLLHVRRDRVRLPDGKEAAREYVVHPGAVAILPMFDDGTLLLERQYRYPLGRVLIEIPAGKIDPGETTAETARRELYEETGYHAERWARLTTIHPLCAYSNEYIELWLAQGLRDSGARNLDEGEFLETFRLPHAQALEWVREGRISDVKTIIAIQWAEKILSGQWPVTQRP
ncbi:MAG: NUDIX hydrolase [Burkholderiales bacterium]|nr:NUDIX hydrolase [Burkholderiales bacterium]